MRIFYSLFAMCLDVFVINIVKINCLGQVACDMQNAARNCTTSPALRSPPRRSVGSALLYQETSRLLYETPRVACVGG